MNISCVIPTRGDVDMAPILHSLPPDFEVIVWDNSVRQDFGVYGRYAAIAEAKHDLIATQDDDCIVPWRDLLTEYVEGERLCNMPAWKQDEYPRSSLLGWGAIFPRNDPDDAFDEYPDKGRILPAPWFRRTCDVVFTTLRPFRRVDLGHEDMAYATNPERMYRQPGHDYERVRATAHAMLAAEH